MGLRHFHAYEDWRTRWGPREPGAWFNDGISMGVTGGPASERSANRR